MPTRAPEAGDLSSQRLDTWLDVACVFPTRSAAARACDGGKVAVNGERAKPHRKIRPGDRLDVTLDGGRRRVLEVAGLCERSIPRAQARALYVDRTPAPTPEEVETRRLVRAMYTPPAGRPDSRDRRLLRRLKGR